METFQFKYRFGDNFNLKLDKKCNLKPRFLWNLGER